MADKGEEWKESEWRSNNNLKMAHFYFDILIKNFKETDPSLNNLSNKDKLNKTYESIEIFWYLFDAIGSWAQAEITGREIVAVNAEVQKILKDNKFDLNADGSHDAETLGWLYLYNSPTPVDSSKLSKVIRPLGAEILTNVGLRNIVKELLKSQSAHSLFWRAELQGALEDLNHGASNNMLTPEKLRKRGDAGQIDKIKKLILFKLSFFEGLGLKKHEALSKVGKAIGKDAETIRSWEKKAKFNPDYHHEVYACRLAGYCVLELGDSDKSIDVNYNIKFYKIIKENLEDDYYYKGRTISVIAKINYQVHIRPYSLRRLSVELKKAESWKKGG